MKLSEINELVEYFQELRNIKNKVMLFAVRDTPGVSFSFLAYDLFRQIGLDENLMGRGWSGYIAIIRNGQRVREILGKEGENLTVEAELTPSMKAVIKSEPFNGGNKAEIIINGMDYSVNRRGINIVVWDETKGALIDSVCFDTHNKLWPCYRKSETIRKIEYNRKEVIKRNILSSEIVLWGNEWVALDFYDKYHSILNIKKVITGKEQELSRNILPGLSVELFNKNTVKNEYVIICRENIDEYYGAVENLANAGLNLGDRALRYDMADAILMGKKIFAFVGYCQVESVKKVFEECPTVRKKFFLRFFHVERVTKKKQKGYQDFVLGIQLADVLARISYSDVFSEGSIEYDIDGNIPSYCHVIRMPQLLFSGFMPYNGVKFRELNEDGRVFGRLEYPFLYKQKILNDFVLQGKSNQEIYAEIIRDDLYTEQEITHSFKVGMRFLENQSELSDVPIYDYIEKNIKKIRLHKDGLHYENPLRFELARRLAKCLNISCEDEINNFEVFCNKGNDNFFQATQVPIFPCIVKCLGLEFDISENCSYHLNVGKWHGSRSVNFKEWIYEYCDFVRSALKIKEVMSED